MEKPKMKKSLQRHIVTCPHCTKDVLDHMTKCPFCAGTLTPRGYSPIMDDETSRRIKRITTIVFSVIAVAVVVYVFFINK